MRVDANTIEEFFAAAENRELDLRAIDALIVDAAPSLKRALFVGPSIVMIGYGMYRQTYANGETADWPVIGLTAQKAHISLYTRIDDDGDQLAERYGARLGKVSCGKSCIRFKKAVGVNLDELRNVIRDAAAWSARQDAGTTS